MKRYIIPFALTVFSVSGLHSGLAFADSSPYAAMSGGMSLDESHALAEKYPATAWNLANTCSGCHGTNGAEFNDIIPPLAGINREKFISIMQRYKKEDNNNFVVMGIVTKPLTDKEIELMADYFAAQKPVQWTQKDWRHDVVNPVTEKGKE